MPFLKLQSSYPSADGEHTISYKVYYPSCEPCAVMQISHGMCEYIERYEGFADYLTSLGFIVCGNDHLGHGGSISDSSDLGYFSKENGWQNAVEDIASLTRIMKSQHPKLPYFLFGHSMGSFLARAYVTKHGKRLDGAIFCGTSGGINAVPQLLTLLDGLKLVHGDRYRSRLVNKLAFGAYNSKIESCDSHYDWLTRDKAVVEKFAADKKCSFIFTLNGFENLTKSLWYVSNDRWFESYPKDLPTYLVAGSADPVGNYGKGVLNVYNKLSLQCCDVELKIYDGARHELVNEINKEQFYGDIADFMLSVTGCPDDDKNLTESDD